MKKFVLILVVIFTSIYSYSQEVIAPQRPTMSESNSIIGKNIIQAENGVNFINDSVEFNTFVRFGLNNRLEFRITSSFNSPFLQFGGKVFIYEGKNALPGISFQIFYDPFLGTQNFSTSFCGNITDNIFYTINPGKDAKWYGIALIGYNIRNAAIFGEYRYHEDYQQLHGGLTYIIKNEIQIDINGGIIDFKTPYIGAGLSFRLNPIKAE